MTEFSSSSKRRLGLSGKKTASAAPKAGFTPIDWALIDPETPDPALISRFRGLTAAKSWAKWSKEGPLDDATAWSYILDMRERRLKGAEEASDPPKPARNASPAGLGTIKSLDERLDGYLPLVVPPILPNDRVSLTQLCELEMRMEELNLELKGCGFGDEDALMKRKWISDELKVAYTSYVDFQKSLKITKLQREDSKESLDLVDAFRADQKDAAAWMETELEMPRCACGVEIAWVWSAFRRVHDPLPYVFVGTCPEGHVVYLGNTEAAQAASAVLQPILKRSLEESYVHDEADTA